MKIVEQITNDGNICLDYDQTLTVREIDKLYENLFGQNVVKEDKQNILFGKVGLLSCNVTYLGHPHPEYKKRIQLKEYYPDVVNKNLENNIETLFVGIYTYSETRLFVVFEPSTYTNKKSHNSSAHIFTMNLQYAQRTGYFSKIDGFGNKIYAFNQDEFVKFIKNRAGIINSSPTSYENVMKLIKDYVEDFFAELPQEWFGVPAYKEMVSNNFNNARQNRWPGWYFEFLFQKYLSKNQIKDIKWNADKTKNGIDLDIVFPKLNWVYGDLKADQIDEDILGNAFDAFDKVVKENNGTVYYICALYSAEKDSNHNYEVSLFWNSLRDEDKAYKNIDDLKRRAGKAMKYSTKLESVNILKIDKDVYEILKQNPFKQGKNSDGKERKEKLKIKKDMISALSVYTYKY